MPVDHAKLSKLAEVQDAAQQEVLMAARIWRDYLRSKDRKFKAIWRKKLIAAIDAEDAASKAWRAEYDFQRADSKLDERLIASFETDGGRLDAKGEQFEEWYATVAVPRLAAVRAQREAHP